MTERAWTPTPAHARAVVGSCLLAALAILLRRPDLVVLAAPLVVAAVWAQLTRPAEPPTIRTNLPDETLFEGQPTQWLISVSDPTDSIEDLAIAFVHSRWWEQSAPGNPQVIDRSGSGDSVHSLAIRPTKWGNRRVREPVVVASSVLNGFRFTKDRLGDHRRVLVLPRETGFDAERAPVTAAGLVGANRSKRSMGGSEFAGIRPFTTGDRLKRIHWPESLRCGELHVTSTWADQDRDVVLLVDAFDEIGRSGGIGGMSSSLDISVRAAAAVAEHFLSVGERVTTITMGVSGMLRVPPSSGLPHLRRVLNSLATIEPSHATLDDGRLPPGIRRGSLILVFSPLTSPSALRRLANLTDRGLNVVAIDCLPPDLVTSDSDDPYESVAWRIELLRRDAQLHRIRAAGLAIVPWRGAGSLDVVLRGVSRFSQNRSGTP